MSRITYKLLFIFLAILQVFDGIFTYLGVQSSLDEEGNYLLCMLMERIGVLPTLILVKVMACIIILVLYNRTKNVKDRCITALFTAVTLVYTYAVFGWVYVLFFLERH